MKRRPSEIRRDLINVSARRLEAEMNDPHANFDDELEYCDDMIDEFAAELTKVNLAKGSPLDAFARILFAKALDEDKAGELLGHLFDGDSVTINRQTGEFFYASSEVLKEMAAE